ncbi:hypothetical protein CcaCcLH18_09522 [Colletotrichum camelliae]|nr:hypothetical protein CcaCcLH18_09522 [Colletotrichum camelliae]
MTATSRCFAYAMMRTQIYSQSSPHVLSKADKDTFFSCCHLAVVKTHDVLDPVPASPHLPPVFTCKGEPVPALKSLAALSITV